MGDGWAFNHFVILMPNECALDCSLPGPCDEAVEEWAPKVNRPAECTPEALRAELKEYGAWDEEELSNDADNWLRIVWIAAGYIRDEARESEHE